MVRKIVSGMARMPLVVVLGLGLFALARNIHEGVGWR